MDHDHGTSWRAVAARLRGTGSLQIAQFEVGAPATEGNLKTLRVMEARLPPDPIMEFYRSCNGVKLLWDGTLAGEPVQGSVNIVPLLESALRAPLQEDGEPLEGILWDEEFEPAVLKRLKRMAIFESIAGRSAYLTYFVGDRNARLYLVEDDRISPIAPDFDTTIDLLERYAGAERLREHLTHSDWQARIEADRVLQLIAAL